MTDTASTTFPKSLPIPEGSSRTYSTTLSDMDGAALEPDSVTSIRMSLRDDRSDAIINNRYRVQVLNSNGGTMSSGGAFRLVLNPLDMVTVGGSKIQKRRMILEVDYLNGHENHEVFFYVENLEDVPQTNLGDHELLHLADALSAGLA